MKHFDINCYILINIAKQDTKMRLCIVTGEFIVNKFDCELDTILKKYDLHKKSISNVNRMIKAILTDLFKSRCTGKKIALWGVGQSIGQRNHASVILNEYSCVINSEISCIVDGWKGFWGEKVCGVEVISPEDLKSRNIDFIIICSKNSADSIISDIETYTGGCEYIDIYEELNKENIKIKYEFFNEVTAYNLLYTQRVSYENEKNTAEKAKKLLELIALYLHIRDFYYAFYYMDEYINSVYELSDMVKKCKNEIRDLLNTIQLINAQKDENIIVYFIDALRGTCLNQESPILKSYKSGAAVYTNIYATAASTYESLVSIVKEKLPFDEDVYEGNLHFDFNDFRIFRDAYERGYKIQLIADHEYTIINPSPYMETVCYEYLPQKIWYMACHMAENNEKHLYMIYAPYEIHAPLTCGFHTQEPQFFATSDIGIKDMSGFLEEQLHSCEVYFDKQMSFYQDFFPYDIRTVIFSDHSQVGYDPLQSKPYYMYYNEPDRSVHCVLLFRGKGIREEIVSSLCTMLDFNSLFEKYIWGIAFHGEGRKYAQYEYYPIKTKILREYAIEKGYQDYIDGIHCLADADSIYVITATGKKELYKKAGYAYRLSHTLDSALQKEAESTNIIFPDA